jgi:catechol 2,3-dioxygenase-like lactoylglutathione lyase family enzyme
MKYKFDAVFYYVSDLERSIRFYVDVLGTRKRVSAPHSIVPHCGNSAPHPPSGAKLPATLAGNLEPSATRN